MDFPLKPRQFFTENCPYLTNGNIHHLHFSQIWRFRKILCAVLPLIRTIQLDLAICRSCEIGCYNNHITMLYDRLVENSVDETPVKFQIIRVKLNPYVRDFVIFDGSWLIKYRLPWVPLWTASRRIDTCLRVQIPTICGFKSMETSKYWSKVLMVTFLL